MADKDCYHCELARLLGEAGCSPLRERLFNLVHAMQVAEVNRLAEVINNSDSIGADKARELADYFMGELAVVYLAMAAKVSVRGEETVGDFVHAAADVWTEVREEPARKMMDSFFEHLNNQVVGRIAKKHSPGN